MTSGEEIVPHVITTSNQCVCLEESKPAVPLRTWLRGKARMAGTACLATLSQPAVGPLLIACVCLGTLAYKKLPKTVIGCTPVKVLPRSMSMAALHGGRATLDRILVAQEAPIDTAGLDGAIKEMETIILNPRVHFQELHRAATKLEMSGKEDDAIILLMEALHKAEMDKNPHEAYEFEMLLVEMLIYKGALEKAWKRKCLTESYISEGDISDARIPLYKAIIRTMLDKDKTSASTFYEDFLRIRQKFHCPNCMGEGSPLYIVPKFDEFEKIVANLKKEIDRVHKLRANNNATVN